MMLPSSRGQLIKINELNIGEQTHESICGPWFTNDYINKWRRRLNMLNTNARPSSEWLTLWRPQTSSNRIYETTKKKSFNFKESHFKTVATRWCELIQETVCWHTVTTGSLLRKKREEASREAAKPPCASLCHSQPKQAFGYLFMPSLIMFSGWKWWGEEEEESAKRLKAIFEHLNASN